MATGVPEADVFQAADAVLARGERPTVERVRVELGRGSPARVGQLLEQWWEQLAQRLKGYALLPDLPGEVAQAFAETWRLALAQAGIAAHAALTETQNALFAEQTSLTQERKLWEIALTEAQANVAQSAAKYAQAGAQLRERQTLVDQLEAQRTDLVQQRERLQEQLARHQIEMDDLRAKHSAAQEHVRTVEDRAHQQVDQTRQEVKSLQQRLEREQRDHHKVVAQLSAQQDAMRNLMRAAEQEAAHQTGRVAALEATLSQWRTQLPPPKRQSSKASPAEKNKPRHRAKKNPH